MEGGCHASADQYVYNRKKTLKLIKLAPVELRMMQWEQLFNSRCRNVINKDSNNNRNYYY